MAGQFVTITDEGSIHLVHPETPEARTWLEEHVDPAAIWLGGSLVVEHRYSEPIVEGLLAAMNGDEEDD